MAIFNVYDKLTEGHPYHPRRLVGKMLASFLPPIVAMLVWSSGCTSMRDPKMNNPRPKRFFEKVFWFVVSTHLKILVSWDDYSQYMEK